MSVGPVSGASQFFQAVMASKIKAESTDTVQEQRRTQTREDVKQSDEKQASKVEDPKQVDNKLAFSEFLKQQNRADDAKAQTEVQDTTRQTVNIYA